MWLLVADIMSNSVYMVCKTCADDAPYTRNHIGPPQIKSSLSVLGNFQKHRDFIVAPTCADTNIFITLYGPGIQT